MGAEVDKGTDRIKGTLVKIPISYFAVVTVSLPLFSLIFCFVTALLFKFDEVNKTVCQVKNLIPSISAITGVSPQRYIWRICIGLHSAPRYAVGFMYYNYYMKRIHNIAPKHHHIFKRLIKVNFWTYAIENSCLIGVTYISNVENYPLHEKIFVVFMFTSLFYEFFTIVLFKWSHVHMTDLQKKSYKMKKIYFCLIMMFTAGLVFFFLRHRLWCEPNAFSWFSVCEYGIAITNIGFHFTAEMDCRGSVWYLAFPSSPAEDNDIAANNNTTINGPASKRQTVVNGNHFKVQ